MKQALCLVRIMTLAGTVGLARESAKRAATMVNEAVYAEPSVLLTEDPTTRTIRQTIPNGVTDLRPSGSAPVDSQKTCPSPGIDGDTVHVASAKGDVTIEPCGRPVGSTPESLLVVSRTIDRMTTGLGYSQGHAPGGPIGLFGSAAMCTLSDGSTWSSGAGSYCVKQSCLDHVEVVGNVVRYYLHPPADGVMYGQTDYNAGGHSAQGSLGDPRALVLGATIGTTTAHCETS